MVLRAWAIGYDLSFQYMAKLRPWTQSPFSGVAVSGLRSKAGFASMVLWGVRVYSTSRPNTVYVRPKPKPLPRASQPGGRLDAGRCQQRLLDALDSRGIAQHKLWSLLDSLLPSQSSPFLSASWQIRYRTGLDMWNNTKPFVQVLR